MTTAAHPCLLTIAETARRLKVSDATVRRMIADGRLPALQLGGPGTSIRVDSSALESWLYDDEGETP